MNGTAEIRTKGLVMHRHRPEDAEVLFERFGSDPKMYEYSGWNPYATREMAAETVNGFINSYSDPTFFGWAIERQGNLIGTIGAYDYDPENSRIEVGMSIDRSQWGNGFATEALTEILNYLTEQEGIRTVTAWCASDNTGSMKAMQKAGMVQTAAEPDAIEVNGRKYDRLIYCLQRRSVEKENE